MLGTQQLFYELQPRHGMSPVKVPAGQMGCRGIRPVMSIGEIEQALALEAPVSPSADPEAGPERLRRWTRLLRSDQRLGPYVFLREWHHLATEGVRFNSQENELGAIIQRSLAQEIAHVFAITHGRATLKLGLWLDPKKTAKEKKKR